MSETPCAPWKLSHAMHAEVFYNFPNFSVITNGIRDVYASFWIQLDDASR